jgi:inosine-uridine nucleoside N-ribohydrolase
VIVVMAGVVVEGSHATATEFNLASDPAAARCLLQSRSPLRWVPLNVATSPTVLPDAVERFQATHGRGVLGQTIVRLLSHVIRMRATEQGAAIPDAVAMALTLDPSLGTWRQRRLTVEGRSRSGRLRHEVGLPNAQVCEAVDRRRILELLWSLWARLADREQRAQRDDAAHS